MSEKQLSGKSEYRQEQIAMQVIAHIHNDFTEKFGIPRQSGLVESVESEIVFCPKYRNPDAFRGMDGYSHFWLIWQFSEAMREDWSPTVRPPRLGGNTRMGVFATRSPFRPNPIGLSCVKLERIEFTKDRGPVLFVSGADLMNGTPILDIKPYLPYADSKPEALGGFAAQQSEGKLSVSVPEELLSKIPAKKRESLKEVLVQDPRPRYQNSPERVYKMSYSTFEVWFTVDGDRLSVCNVVETKKSDDDKQGAEGYADK